MATYTQYEAAPQGTSYLVANIKPWEDYVVFRSDEDTSIAVYGIKQEDFTWEDATVRILERTTSSGYNTYYDVSETVVGSVTVDITNPYYAYGNVIGVNYDLPTSNSITCMIVCGAVVVFSLVKLFQLVFSLKRGVTR